MGEEGHAPPLVPWRGMLLYLVLVVAWVCEGDALLAHWVTAPDLLKMGIVDRIVEEPAGGAHSDTAAMIRSLGNALDEELRALSFMTPDQLVAQRAERFYEIGRKGF